MRVDVSRDVETNERESRWLRYALCALAGLFAIRLLYAATVPLDLVHDEAYYWDWSRNLDWGYYSKPPMVAWLIALSTGVFGSSPLAVRLPAIVLGTGGLLFVYLLGARMFGPKAGFWSMLLIAATPGSTAVALLMTIDAPLLFCWSAALYALWRFLEDEKRRPLWMAATSIALGLGLLCKQTMIGFVPLAGIFLLTGREDRRQLLRWDVLLCPVAALLFLAPVIWWNSHHNWITLQHTSEHFSAQSASLLKHVTRSLEFIGTQFAVATPLTFAMLVTIAFVACRRVRTLGRRERFLLCFSILPLAGVILLSLKQRVEPNWPAPFYVAGFVLLAGAALGAGTLKVPAWITPRRLAQAAAVGGLFVLATYGVPLAPRVAGSKLDPAVRLRGWDELGQQVGRHFEHMPPNNEQLIIVAAGRAVASELAFYTPGQPKVYLYNESDRVESQYDVWGGPGNEQGQTALIVTQPDKPVPPSLAGSFADIKAGELIEVPIGHGRSHRYQLWQASGYRGWPRVRTVAADWNRAQR